MFFMFLWVGSQKLISMGLEDGSVGKVHAGWAREGMNTQSPSIQVSAKWAWQSTCIWEVGAGDFWSRLARLQAIKLQDHGRPCFTI